MTKFSMNLTEAIKIGTHAAAAGWTADRLSAYLTGCGYRTSGLTARRVLSAYRAQLARG